MNTTSKNYLTTLRIIYLAMNASMVLAAFVSFSLISSQQIATNSDPQLQIVFRYALFVVTPLFLGIGYFLFKKYLATAVNQTSLKSKLFHYQIAVMIRSACFEIPGLLGIVAMFITGELSFLLFTAIILMMLLMLIPGTGAIVQDLGLSQKEKMILENPESIIE